MKLANANKIRKQYIEELLTYFRCEGSSDGEDCGMITSNSFNFPVVDDDGEDGWVEIVVKIPKYDGNEGYALREEYEMKVRKRAEKAKAQAEIKAKKIAKDKARREKEKAKE